MIRGTRTPSRIQVDPTECGAVCLGIVAQFHGKYVSASRLRGLCEVSRSGSNAKNILLAAKELGLDGRGIRPAQLSTVRTPAILHWNRSHFVVLEKSNSVGVWLNDPAMGHRFLTWVEFQSCFSGVALELWKGEEFRAEGHPPKAHDLVREYSGRYSKEITFLVLATFFSAVPTLFFAVGSRAFVDKILLSGEVSPLYPLLWILVLSALLQVTFFFLRASVLRRLQFTIESSLVDHFHKRILSRPLQYYLQRYPSELASRALLNANLAKTIVYGFLDNVSNIAAVIPVAVCLCLLSPLLATLSILLLASNIVLYLWYGKRRSEVGQRLSVVQGKLHAVGMEAIETIETIQSSGSQPAAFQNWHQAMRALLSERSIADGIAATLTSFSVGTTLVASSLVIGMGGILILRGEMTLGTMVAFQVLMPFLVGPVQKGVQFASQVQSFVADNERVSDVVERDTNESVPVPNEDLSSVSQITDNEASLSLTLSEVSFGYGLSRSRCISGLTLNIPAGQWVGITGPSGAGKSTLGRLMAGLYTPNGGTVRWNSPLGSGNDCALQHRIGYVDQESVLFAASLRENLQFGCTQVSDRDIIDVCSELGLDSLVRDFPNGLGGTIDEGGRNLSGGQRQRIDIARVLLRKPLALVLDEGTSSLDEESEALVLRALKRRSITCILLSHRPKVLETCDVVFVMDHGQVADRGGHSELLQRSDRYRRLLGCEV